MQTAILWILVAVLAVIIVRNANAVMNIADPVPTTSQVIEKPQNTTVPKRTYNTTLLSTELQDYIVELCEQYTDVPPEIVMAIIQVESGGDSQLVGDKGQSYGLMQINVQYHTERMARLGVIDILDVTSNIRVGVDYLAELYSYGRSTEWVLMAYNGGLAYATEMWSDGYVSAYARRVLDVAQRIGIEQTSEEME